MALAGVLCLLTATAGCSGQEHPPPAPKVSVTPVRSYEEILAEVRSGLRPGRDEVVGTLIHIDDAGLEPGPETDGSILAFRSETANWVWAAADVPPARRTPSRLPKVGFRISAADVAEQGGVTAPFRNGRFRLRPITAGRYLICSTLRDSMNTYNVYGCKDNVALKPPTTVETTTGISGFLIRSHPS